MIAIDKIKEAVNQKLNQVNEMIIECAVSKFTNLIPQISNHLTSSGGKRIRPLLTLYVSNVLGGGGENKDVLLATAVEYIHTATLLHDDVIDESETRRGKATANNVFGCKNSILVGDFLFSQAFKLMVKTGSLKSLELLANTSAVISEGEIVQLDNIGNMDLSKEEYISICRSKTAELFAASAACGALSADYVNYEKYFEYGLNLGIAFQIVDDILDYTSTAEILKKNPGDDFREGKVTLPLIVAFKGKYKNDVLKAFKEKNFEKTCEILHEINAFEESAKLAMSYSEIAAASVEDELLKNLAYEMTYRVK